MPDFDSSNAILRFNRLMRDLHSGSPSRNSYLPWEIELLLDFDSCVLGGASRKKVLERYQRAVLRRLEQGQPPLRLSEYLSACAERQRRRRAGPAVDLRRRIA
jgi:hypothetical protein